MKKVMDVSPC